MAKTNKRQRAREMAQSALAEKIGRQQKIQDAAQRGFLAQADFDEARERLASALQELEALGDEVRVTVIAAGFDGGMPKRRDNGTVLRREPQPQVSQADVRAAAQAAASKSPEQPAPAQVRESTTPDSATAGTGSRPQPSRQAPQVTFAPSAPSAPSSQGQPARQPRQVQFDDDDLDVPDFLK